MQVKPQNYILTGGVNLNKDPRVITPDKLALSKNAFPVIPGILSKRSGVRALRVAYSSSPYRLIPLDLVPLPLVTGYQFAAHLHTWNTNPPSPSHTLMASSFDKEQLPLTNSPNITVDNFLTQYEPVCFVRYNNIILAIVPGVEGFYAFAPTGLTYSSPSYNVGYLWQKISFGLQGSPQTQSIPVKPRVGSPYKQRMYYGNLGPNAGHWIVAADLTRGSNLVDPAIAIIGTDAMSFNGRHVELQVIAGEDIVAMREVTMASLGSQMDSMLLVMTSKSAVLLSGELSQSTDTGGTDPNFLLGTLTAHKFNFECGCVGDKAIIKTPVGWIWASPNNVWLMDGNVPRPIGFNIRPALLSCPSNSQQYWSLAYANGILVLQLVVNSGVTEAGAAAGSFSTNVHQYWYLDLRSGAPPSSDLAMWYGPMEIVDEDGSNTVYGPITSVTDENGVERVLALACRLASSNATYLVDILSSGAGFDSTAGGITTGLQWAAGSTYGVGDVVRPTHNNTTAGVTNRLHVCTVAGTSGGTEPAWTIFGGGATFDNTVTWTEIAGYELLSLTQRVNTAFQTDIRTRDSALNDAVHEKLLRRVDLNINSNAPVNVSLTAQVNQNPTAIPLQTSKIGGVAPVLGVDELPFAIGGVQSQALAFRPPESQLVKCRQVQLKVQDTTDYIIDSTNDHLVFAYFKSTGVVSVNNFKWFQIAIPQGNYASISTILTAILNSLSNILANIMAGGGGPSLTGNMTVNSAAPYFSQISIECDGTNGLVNTALAMIFANSDVVTPFIGGTDTTTAYFSRSKKLANLLGFDTGQKTWRSVSLHTTEPTTPADVTLLGANVATNNIIFDGCQIVQEVNSGTFAITQMTALLQPKTAVPLSKQSR